MPEEREPARRILSGPGPEPEHPAGPAAGTVGHAIHATLAAVIRDPRKPVIGSIQEIVGAGNQAMVVPVLQECREAIREAIGGFAKVGTNESQPVFIDRLSFRWRFLRQADTAVLRFKANAFAEQRSKAVARAAFSTLLRLPIADPLLDEIIAQLRLGPDARFFEHYAAFKKAKSPTRLPDPFGSITSDSEELIRTLAYWCIRARREQYVDVPVTGPVRIEFGYVVDNVMEDMRRWSTPSIASSPKIAFAVETELNNWLSTSYLQAPSDSDALEFEVDRDIAKAFVKHHGLTTKLAAPPRRPGEEDPRLKALEQQVRQYAEENQQLEDKLRRSSRAAAPGESAAASPLDSLAGLRDVLQVIDSKYAFDTLNRVQSGDSTNLTLQSFVSHLFYSLRKRGFIEYPAQTEFPLRYEDSGLYDCIDFEIPPGAVVVVRVVQKGWALQDKGVLAPVRRAKVTPATSI